MKMGVGFWMVAIAAGVGGYFACRGLKTMEEEIRDEIAGREAATGVEEGSSQEDSALPPGPAATPTPVVTLESQVLNLIRTRPGRLQVDLYRDLSQVNRKELQELLLRLDRAGKVRRVKEKSTYKLFPA